jgi:hypothetical protein
MIRIVLLLGGLIALLAISVAAAAQSDASDDKKLAQATQNPVSDLVSIPLQYNFFSGGGLGGQTLYNLNIQPVLPLSIGKRWNLVARTIVPYFNAPTQSGVTRSIGVGDVVEQIFFTPSRPMKLIWGAGPLFSVPTATNNAARTGDWAMGPAVVLVSIKDPFVLGVLVTQLWTIAADADGSDINQFSVQPFLNWNLAHGWTFTYNPIMSANWQAANKWTVPVGLGVSNITAIGRQPVSVGISYFNNVVRPPGTGSSQFRLVTSFLFPKAKEK